MPFYYNEDVLFFEQLQLLRVSVSNNAGKRVNVGYQDTKKIAVLSKLIRMCRFPNGFKYNLISYYK